MKPSKLRAAIGEARWLQQCRDDLETAAQINRLADDLDIEAERARRSGVDIFPEHLLALTGRLQRLCVAMWATPQPILGEIAATWGALAIIVKEAEAKGENVPARKIAMLAWKLRAQSHVLARLLEDPGA